jgi:predicted phage terminase large subunit-like protein
MESFSPAFEPDPFEPRLNTFIPHVPTPHQAAFLLLDCLEAFYGGAGGGGKSDALLMSALQYADIPGYHALIIRRHVADLTLPNALLDRARGWLRGRKDVHWNESKNQWQFASGATLTFGYLAGSRDIDRYASAEFHFIGVDELTQFSEKVYLDLFARLRAPACPACKVEMLSRGHRDIVHQQHRKDCSECIEIERQRLRVVRKNIQHVEAAHIPLRMRAASNPGNVGHDWVKRRFVERLGAPAGDRIFVPARLNENPYINREDYVKSLLNLDPVTRARILKGDWEARSSRGVLRREWFEIIELAPAELSRVRYWDTAYQKKKTSDFTVGVKYGIARNGMGYILHVARAQATPHEVENFIANIAGQDTRSIPIVLQQEPGSGSALWIDSMRRGVLHGYPIKADPVRGSKFERSQAFRAAAEAGNVKILRGAWNEAFLEECEQFSPDEREYAHDDQVDAACGGFTYLAANRHEFSYTPVRSAQQRPLSVKEQDAIDDARGGYSGLGGLIKSRRWRPGGW